MNSLQLRSVEGPKGPHLFRSSQTSGEFDFEYALQMSPMLPKKMDFGTAQQPSIIVPDQSFDFSIDGVVQQRDLGDRSSEVSRWSAARVIDWLVDSDLDASIVQCFQHHDITGDILLDLDFDDLKDIGIESFGKRHALWNALCILQGHDGVVSPQQTPFQDISRPVTTRQDSCETPIDGEMGPDGKKRRGRKPLKHLDIITPAESVSIVAIEQLLPKPHKCAKGDRCAKYRKQQRELQRLQDEHSESFPISPTKGGHIFVAGNPGNAMTANNMLLNARLRAQQPDSFYRPQSDAMPSVVASSDLLGPGQLPELHADMLDQLDKRDPLENVKAFISFQHIHTPSPPAEDELQEAILTPAQYQAGSLTLDLFPAEHVDAFAAMSAPELQPLSNVRTQHEQLRSLPRLDIPRSSSAQGNAAQSRPSVATEEVARSATASPGRLYRFATPASEMDVPVSAAPVVAIARNASQSVPPDMHFRDQAAQRPQSRARGWRRPSVALEAVKENEELAPSTLPRPSMSSQRTQSSGCTSMSGASGESRRTVPDPAHGESEVKIFGYGSECSQAGWMRKRKTKMLRHEWQDAHFRLKGTQLAMHADDRLRTKAKELINVDQYSVTCSTASSNGKLGAAFKSFSIKNGSPEKKTTDGTAFAFQLIPEQEGPTKLTHAKTHHFAVKSKDERIDWMRELMLAKALQQKRAGYEVEINGVQA